MRLANGTGSVHKMPGRRRKPWRCRVTTHIEFDEENMRYRQKYKDLGFFATRNEALKALMDYNANPFDLNALEVTLDQCYKEAEKSFTEGRKNNYKAAYRYLEPLKDKPIRSIKAPQMQACIDSCTTSQQVEIKTVAHKIFDYAMKMEFIDHDPSRYLHSNNPIERKKREVLTTEQITLLNQQPREWWVNITLMLLYSGMRTKELKELQPEWIHIDEGYIDINKAKNRSSLRQIPIHSHVLPLFSDYKDFGCNLYGYTHEGLNKALKTFCGHTAHDCRHTFATRMRECGCEPLILQLLLGHTPTTITERVYTHITLAELSQNLELLNYELDSVNENRTDG